MSFMAGLLSAGGSLLGSALGYQSQLLTNNINRKNIEDTNKSNEAIAERTNYWNREIARDTNETNRQIAEQNLGFQRQMQDYNRALQQQIFEREDTSYQRTAQDMLAAGLNPLDMQGTNGAGEIISQSPLENTFQAQVGSPMQAHRNESFKQENAINSAISASSALASVAEAINSVENGQIQRDSIQLDNDKKILENAILAHDYGIDLFGKGKKRSIGQSYIGDDDFNWSNAKGWKNAVNVETYNNAYIERINRQREYNHKANAGIYDTDTDFERILTAISDWVNNGRGAEEWEKLEKTFPILKAFRNSY